MVTYENRTLSWSGRKPVLRGHSNIECTRRRWFPVAYWNGVGARHGLVGRGTEKGWLRRVLEERGRRHENGCCKTRIKAWTTSIVERGGGLWPPRGTGGIPTPQVVGGGSGACVSGRSEAALVTGSRAIARGPLGASPSISPAWSMYIAGAGRGGPSKPR